MDEPSELCSKRNKDRGIVIIGFIRRESCSDDVDQSECRWCIRRWRKCNKRKKCEEEDGEDSGWKAGGEGVPLSVTPFCWSPAGLLRFLMPKWVFLYKNTILWVLSTAGAPCVVVGQRYNITPLSCQRIQNPNLFTLSLIYFLWLPSQRPQGLLHLLPILRDTLTLTFCKGGGLFTVLDDFYLSDL